MNRRILGVVAWLALCGPVAAHAHYHMLLPDKPSVKAGETVTFTYQLGHPFEHQLFDTQAPEQLFVLAPNDTRTDLAGKLEKVKVEGADGKKVTGLRVAFTPEKRGDYVVVALSAATTVEGEKLPLQDLVKVVLHVQAQTGWDRRAADPRRPWPEPSPLTRPYGLRAGMVFQVEVEEPAEGGAKPLAGLLVEVERYNATPPKELPPDEHITRTMRTDRVGVATATLAEPGWWAVTAIRDRDGIRQRGTFWVHVEGPPEPVK